MVNGHGTNSFLQRLTIPSFMKLQRKTCLLLHHGILKRITLNGKMAQSKMSPKSQDRVYNLKCKTFVHDVIKFVVEGSALDHPCHQWLRMSYVGLPGFLLLDRQGFFFSSRLDQPSLAKLSFRVRPKKTPTIVAVGNSSGCHNLEHAISSNPNV